MNSTSMFHSAVMRYGLTSIHKQSMSKLGVGPPLYSHRVLITEKLAYSDSNADITVFETGID